MVYRQKATQLSLESFGSALGTPLSPDNEWVQYAELIPWAKLEEAYQLQFPSKTGREAISIALWCNVDQVEERPDRPPSCRRYP